MLPPIPPPPSYLCLVLPAVDADLTVLYKFMSDFYCGKHLAIPVCVCMTHVFTPFVVQSRLQKYQSSFICRLKSTFKAPLTCFLSQRFFLKIICSRQTSIISKIIIILQQQLSKVLLGWTCLVLFNKTHFQEGQTMSYLCSIEAQIIFITSAVSVEKFSFQQSVKSKKM